MHIWKSLSNLVDPVKLEYKNLYCWILHGNEPDAIERECKARLQIRKRPQFVGDTGGLLCDVSLEDLRQRFLPFEKGLEALDDHGWKLITDWVIESVSSDYQVYVQPLDSPEFMPLDVKSTFGLWRHAGSFVKTTGPTATAESLVFDREVLNKCLEYYLEQYPKPPHARYVTMVEFVYCSVPTVSDDRPVVVYDTLKVSR